MQLIPMTLSNVSLTASAYPDKAEWQQISYDGENLVVPDNLVSKVQAIDLAAAAKAALLNYASSKRGTIAAGGITVNVGTSSAPVPVEASTDAASLVLLQGAATIATSNPSQTFQWVPETGTPITLTAAQMIAMFTAVSAFLQATFTTLAAVINAINVGTITTTAEVDGPPSSIPAWPTNS